MPIRLTYFLGFVAICGLVIISLYLQFFDGFLPCPLCVLQRVSFILLGILFLIGLLLYKKHWVRLSISILAILFSLIGISLAGRQIWLQHFPPADTSECGVSIQYMMQVLPMNEVLQKIFAGSAECTQRGWEFFNLNMAEWSLIFFILFLIFSLYLFARK